jgi:hypothetical protein
MSLRKSFRLEVPSEDVAHVISERLEQKRQAESASSASRRAVSRPREADEAVKLKLSVNGIDVPLSSAAHDALEGMRAARLVAADLGRFAPPSLPPVTPSRAAAPPRAAVPVTVQPPGAVNAAQAGGRSVSRVERGIPSGPAASLEMQLALTVAERDGALARLAKAGKAAEDAAAAHRLELAAMTDAIGVARAEMAAQIEVIDAERALRRRADTEAVQHKAEWARQAADLASASAQSNAAVRAELTSASAAEVTRVRDSARAAAAELQASLEEERASTAALQKQLREAEARATEAASEAQVLRAAAASFTPHVPAASPTAATRREEVAAARLSALEADLRSLSAHCRTVEEEAQLAAVSATERAAAEAARTAIAETAAASKSKEAAAAKVQVALLQEQLRTLGEQLAQRQSAGAAAGIQVAMLQKQLSVLNEQAAQLESEVKVKSAALAAELAARRAQATLVEADEERRSIAEGRGFVAQQEADALAQQLREAVALRAVQEARMDALRFSTLEATAAARAEIARLRGEAAAAVAAADGRTMEVAQANARMAAATAVADEAEALRARLIEAEARGAAQGEAAAEAQREAAGAVASAISEAAAAVAFARSSAAAAVVKARQEVKAAAAHDLQRAVAEATAAAPVAAGADDAPVAAAAEKARSLAARAEHAEQQVGLLTAQVAALNVAVLASGRVVVAEAAALLSSSCTEEARFNAERRAEAAEGRVRQLEIALEQRQEEYERQLARERAPSPAGRVRASPVPDDEEEGPPGSPPAESLDGSAFPPAASQTGAPTLPLTFSAAEQSSRPADPSRPMLRAAPSRKAEGMRSPAPLPKPDRKTVTH